MTKSKKEFIEDLINQAQCNTWKNELAIAYKEAENESDLSVEATKDIIKRDESYVAFLEGELNKCE